jgi:uncharacterized protein
VNKTALITGASGGIGAELARVHASKGGDLVLVARTVKKLDEFREELIRKHKIKVHIIVKDLAEKDSVRELYDEVLAKGLEINFLINNAGFGDFGFFSDTDWRKQEKMINLNVTALTHLTRLFIPDMIRRGEGKILNVASTAAFQPGPTMSVYFATKAYVLSFSQAINNELRGHGITVTALCPGSTESDFHVVTMGDPGLVKERKMDSAIDVAEFGYRSMIKGKPVAIYGFKNVLMANAVRFFPREFIVSMARRIQEKKHRL